MSITISGSPYIQQRVANILGNEQLVDFYVLGQESIGQVIDVNLQNGVVGAFGPNPGVDWAFEGVMAETSGSTITGSQLVWQSQSTGAIVEWDVDPVDAQLIGGGELALNPGTSWHLVNTTGADFNGDGNSDLLFQDPSTGQVAVWDMDGSEIVGGGVIGLTPGSNWKPVTTVDANGDGKSDIVWQNQSTGQVAVWEMDSNNVIGGGPVGPAPGAVWSPQGALSTGGGFYTLSFQNKSANEAAIWDVNGTTTLSGTTQAFPASLTILGSIDILGSVSSYFLDTAQNNIHVQTNSASAIISGFSAPPVAWTIGPHQV